MATEAVATSLDPRSDLSQTRAVGPRAKAGPVIQHVGLGYTSKRQGGADLLSTAGRPAIAWQTETADPRRGPDRRVMLSPRRTSPGCDCCKSGFATPSGLGGPQSLCGRGP